MDNTRDSIARWMDGIPYEVAFWNNTYRWTASFNRLKRWSHYGSPIQLEGFDAQAFLASKTGNPKVLDVGCGMSYATGNYLLADGKPHPLDIHYVDPLADSFNRILARHHREMPRIEFGMIEFLSAFYPAHDVSLVIVQNALDHSARPLKGICECLEVLETGGCLYLKHHPNEAETEHYKGFHQYNICEEGTDLVIWNKQERHNVTALLNGFASVATSRTEDGEVVAVIKKLRDVPPAFITDKADKHDLCRMVQLQIADTGNVRRAFKNKLAYWKYNLIQCAMQRLSWHTRMKIKRLIKQH